MAASASTGIRAVNKRRLVFGPPLPRRDVRYDEAAPHWEGSNALSSFPDTGLHPPCQCGMAQHRLGHLDYHRQWTERNPDA